MQRSKFLQILIGALPVALFTEACAQVKPQSERKKFYVTGLYHTKEFNDCTLPPLVCYGSDSLDALAHSGLTVWTEEEWKAAQASGALDCKNIK